MRFPRRHGASSSTHESIQGCTYLVWASHWAVDGLIFSGAGRSSEPQQQHGRVKSRAVLRCLAFLRSRRREFESLRAHHSRRTNFQTSIATSSCVFVTDFFCVTKPEFDDVFGEPTQPTPAVFRAWRFCSSRIRPGWQEFLRCAF